MVVVAADGSWKPLLTAGDGLADPTSLAIRGGTVYVDNTGFFTGVPSLMTAELEG